MALVALVVGLLVLYAVSSGVNLVSPPNKAQHAQGRARTSRPSNDVGGPTKAETPPAPKTPPPLPGGEWPTGTLSSELALIATNIPPGAPHKSTALLLDVKSDRYVQLSPGDQVGQYEVVRISLDWVQLRHAGSSSWVSYLKRQQRSRPTRYGHRRRAGRQGSDRSPPPKVRRRKFNGPTVTYKWILGRINLAGELEDHIQPKMTAKGLRVGRVTSGFRRIGLRVGDVVKRAGDFDVHSLEGLRNGLQRAAKPGGTGSLVVLRNGREVTLDFGVR